MKEGQSPAAGAAAAWDRHAAPSGPSDQETNPDTDTIIDTATAAGTSTNPFAHLRTTMRTVGGVPAEQEAEEASEPELAPELEASNDNIPAEPLPVTIQASSRRW
jgi:hypothetical protein